MSERRGDGEKGRNSRAGSPDSFPGKGVEQLTPDQKKVRELEAELAETRMERDILKKAIGIFGKTRG